MRDLVFAARALRRTPILLVTAIGTLALGIGVSTGVFAVAFELLIRPLPYADAARLVAIPIHRPSQKAISASSCRRSRNGGAGRGPFLTSPATQVPNSRFVALARPAASGWPW
jgi:hypothetical protein